MTTYHFATETPRIASRPALAARLEKSFFYFYRSCFILCDFLRLGVMSVAELADIGLCRGDLHVAIDVPFGRDPTTKLRALAEDRAATVEDFARRVG